MPQIPDYREVLKRCIEERKARAPEVTSQRLAEAMRVQPPYLSKALNGKAHLSADQLYLGCRHLKLSPERQEYLLLLLEYSRSIVSERKGELATRLAQYEATEAKTEKHIEIQKLSVQMNDATEYYLDPLFQLVHIFLSVERYQSNPELIARDLSLPRAKIRSIVERLQEMKIIRRNTEGNRWESVIPNVHLPKDSPLCRPHQHLVRMTTMQRLESLPAERTYNLAITFSADQEARKAIQALFLDFLARADKLIEQAPSEDVFQLNFDLFSWN